MPSEDFGHTDVLRDRMAGNLERFVRSEPLSGDRHAAVAVTLVPQADGSSGFVITRRSMQLKNHRGQWALPGGRIDEGESPVGAALRELGEEVGIYERESAVIGQLDDFATRSGFVITPIVVWSNAAELIPNPHEVDTAFPLPLADLDRDDAPILEHIPQSERPVIMMPLMGQVVFAPTAAILYQLREVALRGLDTRVAHFEQPVFAWR